MKKIFALVVAMALLSALSFCASSLYIRDGAVTYEDIPVSSDGAISEEELTLGTVENLKFVKSARGSVTLSWDKLKNVYAYQVFIKYEGDKNFSYNYTTKSNEVTIKEIDNEGAIKFIVRGFCYDAGKVVYGEFSNEVEALTKPENVTEIYTRSITDNSITLYWNKAEGATGYRVYIYSKKDEKFKLYKRTSRTAMTISGLDKNRGYIFKIMSYKRINNSTALGDYSSEYKEFTYNSGSLPRSKAQAAQLYNELIAKLKEQQNMTIQYNKSIDTEYIGCSKNNLVMTVKNTLSLFEGTLKKNYIYKDGYNEEKSANKLIEPYGKKASLARDDIKVYSVAEKNDGYIMKIILKSESKFYNKGDSFQKSYFDGVLTLPQFRSLKTTPLAIDSAESYYDGGTLSITVSDGRITAFNIQAAMISDIDFSVADVKASTVVAYEMTENYKIKYNNENKKTT